MKSIELVLDLGIGTGGEYILHDNPQRTRIGVDNEFDSLSMMKNSEEYHNTLAVVADADLVEELHLPFRDKAFDRVEIYFPSDELLYNLCGNDNGLLWRDLGRVVKNNGVIEIILDLPHYTHMRGINVRGKNLVVCSPQYDIWKVGQKSGFNMQIKEMSSDELKSIGTHFSKFALRGKGFSRNDVYRIIATKKN